MIPIGLAIRYRFGGTVNVYGELVVERALGHWQRSRGSSRRLARSGCR
jgi:hypothetical protein